MLIACRWPVVNETARRGSWINRQCAQAFPHCAALFLYAVRKLFDHRVREHLAGNALDHGAGGLGREPIVKQKREILALAHCGYIRKSDLAQGVVDGLALRIEDRSFQCDMDMRLHHLRL